MEFEVSMFAQSYKNQLFAINQNSIIGASEIL